MIDLSHPLYEAMPVYPGDPIVEVSSVDKVEWTTSKDRHVNLGRMTFGLHSGTHMDAPFHFFNDGATIDQISVSQCAGDACAVRVQGERIGRKDLIQSETIIRQTKRVLLNTGWFHRWGDDDYFTAHPVLTTEAAEFLRDTGAILVGIDTPSVDHSPFEAHLVLLGAGIVIVENLTNLDALPPTPFEFAAFPLAIKGRDASPVRAVAWR
jgi:kynurenine formamidase